MKTVRAILLLFGLFFLSPAQAFTQQRQCASVEVRERAESDSHLSWKKVSDQLLHLQDRDIYPDKLFRSVISIPVVVHVIWKDSSDNISDDQIHSQLDVLNEDFRRLNDNFNITPLSFADVSADCEIEFCLAQRDPDGDPTTGITRTKTFETNIGSGDHYYQTSEGGHNAWDVDKYVNIWVCEIGNGIFGFATFPGMADPIQSDGIVIEPDYFGRTGTVVNSYPNHLGRTTTHEMGHYLGLDHVWGKNSGGCNDDDDILDTPPQESPSDGCPSFPLRDICSPRAPGVQFYNFMDNTDDSCMTMFTQGQKTRMMTVLNTLRSGLFNSLGCNTVSTTDPGQKKLTAYPNPFNNDICVQNPQGDIEHIHVYDSNGVSIYESMISNRSDRICITATQWPAGVYIVLIEFPEITAATRIIKQ